MQYDEPQDHDKIAGTSPTSSAAKGGVSGDCGRCGGAVRRDDALSSLFPDDGFVAERARTCWSGGVGGGGAAADAAGFPLRSSATSWTRADRMRNGGGSWTRRWHKKVYAGRAVLPALSLIDVP